MKKTVSKNWLSLIKNKKVKEQKLHAAQLCATGYCKVFNK